MGKNLAYDRKHTRKKRCQICGGGSPYRDVIFCQQCRVSKKVPAAQGVKPKGACAKCGELTSRQGGLCAACAAYDDYRRMLIVEAIDPACVKVQKWWPLTAAGWREGCGG